MTVKRSTTKRDRHRRIIAKGEPPCWICGEPIDYSLPHLDPGQYVVDHVVPLARGGADELANLRAAHRHCNRQRGDRLPDEPYRARPRAQVVVPLTTTRNW